jgi:hypothetical protein
VTDPLGASYCNPGPSGAKADGSGTQMQSSGPSYFRSQNRNAVPPGAHPSAQYLSAAFPPSTNPSGDSHPPGSMECGWSKHSPPSTSQQINRQRLPERPSAGAGDTQQKSQLAPAPSSSVRGAEKRKEELSELQEDALNARSQAGGEGVDTKKERKEGERKGSNKRKGARAHARKGGQTTGTRRDPDSSKQEVRPASAPNRVRGKEDQEATSPSRPRLAPWEGPASGLQCPCRVLSCGKGCSPRRKARTAGPAGRSRPRRRARQLQGDASRPCRLPEAGRVLQTLLEIHRHLHPASASSRGRHWKSREARGSGGTGNPDVFSGCTAATSAARSCGGLLARWS